MTNKTRRIVQPAWQVTKTRPLRDAAKPGSLQVTAHRPLREGVKPYHRAPVALSSAIARTLKSGGFR